MEEKYYYSPHRGGFYLLSFKAEYQRSDAGWPDDAVAVSDRCYAQLMAGQSCGNIITANGSGQPMLCAPPPPTQAQIVADAETQKTALMQAANEVIAPLQDAIELNMATDEEKSRLLLWKEYRVLLNRVDTGTVPGVDWPKKPADSAHGL